MHQIGSVGVEIQKVAGGAVRWAEDQLAVEEPLEIRIAFGARGRREVRAVAVTMRTPGNDFELAAGFLMTEGIIGSQADVERMVCCGPETGALRLHNVVRVELSPALAVDLKKLERHFYVSSSCGVCGKASIEAIRAASVCGLTDGFEIEAERLCVLPEFLRTAQAVFDLTGGLHAAALFGARGKLAGLREDVGRHNAVDKVIGAMMREEIDPRDKVLMVSGRASFELVQKAVLARIPVLAAVGAPSSLAVELAREFNLTLAGFVREERFNIYAGGQRVRGCESGKGIVCRT